MAKLADAPRRLQDRKVEADAPPVRRPLGAEFENGPDTDWTLAPNRAWIEDVVPRWRERSPEAIPLQVGGEFRGGAREGQGRDPSRPGRLAYRFALANPDDVDRALTVARAAQPAWATLRTAERDAQLEACAAKPGRRRGDLIGAMILDGAKTVTEADAEVSEAVGFARYYAPTLRATARELDDCRMAPPGAGVGAPPRDFPL